MDGGEESCIVGLKEDWGLFTDTSDTSDGEESQGFLGEGASSTDLSRSSSCNEIVASLAPNGLSLLNSLVMNDVRAAVGRAAVGGSETFDLVLRSERRGAAAVVQRWHITRQEARTAPSPFLP